MIDTPHGISRRRALQIIGGSGLGGLAGCAGISTSPSGSDGGAADDGPGATPRAPPSESPDERVALTAATSTQQPASETDVPAWLYGDTFPAPEIRVSKGDVVGVSVTNRLPESTTIHWHGVPVANAMDGVPDVTQAPVASGDSFEYRFRADPPGTYFYHSHVGLQLDRGLAGPLVVEEADPHVEYDREYVFVLDDYLAEEPRLPDQGWGQDQGGPDGDGVGMGGGRDGGPGGMGGGPGGGAPGLGGGPMAGPMTDYRPPYRGMLLNGRLGENPPTFEVSDGERVRMRFVNASSATMFEVGLGGHTLEISHADGRPVEPVSVDSFTFGPGERYDAIVAADSPGSWELVASPVRGTEPSAHGIVRYDDESEDRTPEPPGTDGRALHYDDLHAIDPLDGLDSDPDRAFDLTLSRGDDGYTWAIGGQVYPDANPLRVEQGEHVRIRMRNRSPVSHPMHLHGHFFQVGDAVKDTVVVPGHMGSATIDFRADNPGDWLFHCHNLYHLEAGMARVISYE